MKRLLEYLTSEKSDNIYEGFWDFMSQLIKSLFGDASVETKNYGEGILAHGSKRYGDSYQNAVSKLLKENDTKKFIKEVETLRKSWVDNKKMDEKQSYAEACFILDLKRKILVDSKKTNDVKLIEKQIEEYKKKAGETFEQVQQEINSSVNQSNNTQGDGPSQELSDATDKAFEEYKNEIEQLCKKASTTPEQLKNVIFELCKVDDSLKTIKDPKIIFTFAVMACGGKIAQAFNESDDVIAMYMGTIAMLIEKKELKISDKEV